MPAAEIPILTDFLYLSFCYYGIPVFMVYRETKAGSGPNFNISVGLVGLFNQANSLRAAELIKDDG